jgi:hypothetical protein
MKINAWKHILVTLNYYWLMVLFIICSLFLGPDCKSGYCYAVRKPYLGFANDDNENGVGEEIMYMAIDSLLYITLIMLVELGVFGMLYEKVKNALVGNQVESQMLDDDVMHEQDRVDGQGKDVFSHFMSLVIDKFSFVKILIIMKKVKR